MVTAHWTRAQLLEALSKGWGTLVKNYSHMVREDPIEVIDWLRQQRFSDFDDLVAHACGLWEDTLKVVPVLCDGRDPRHDPALFLAYSGIQLRKREGRDDVNPFSAGRYLWRYGPHGLLLEFKRLMDQLRVLIENLPEAGLENEEVYKLIFNAVVEDYEKHRHPKVIGLQMV